MSKQKIIGVVIFCIIFFPYLIWRFNLATKINLDREFSGIIEKVVYDEKDFPTITVGGKNYYLEPGYNFNHKIELGDSIIKYKGSRVYKLIKKNSGLVMIFE